MGILEFSLVSLCKNHLAKPSHFQTSLALILKLAQTYKAGPLSQPESTTKKIKASPPQTRCELSSGAGTPWVYSGSQALACRLHSGAKGQLMNAVGTIRL